MPQIMIFFLLHFQLRGQLLQLRGQLLKLLGQLLLLPWKRRNAANHDIFLLRSSCVGSCSCCRTKNDGLPDMVEKSKQRIRQLHFSVFLYLF
jgi:hypothetical protein